MQNPYKKHTHRLSCGLVKRQNMWETTNIPLTYIDHGESAANYKTTNTTNNSHRYWVSNRKKHIGGLK